MAIMRMTAYSPTSSSSCQSRACLGEVVPRQQLHRVHDGRQPPPLALRHPLQYTLFIRPCSLGTRWKLEHNFRGPSIRTECRRQCLARRQHVWAGRTSHHPVAPSISCSRCVATWPRRKAGSSSYSWLSWISVCGTLQCQGRARRHVPKQHLGSSAPLAPAEEWALRQCAGHPP